MNFLFKFDEPTPDDDGAELFSRKAWSQKKKKKNSSLLSSNLYNCCDVWCRLEPVFLYQFRLVWNSSATKIVRKYTLEIT